MGRYWHYFFQIDQFFIIFCESKIVLVLAPAAYEFAYIRLIMALFARHDFMS